MNNGMSLLVPIYVEGLGLLLRVLSSAIRVAFHMTTIATLVLMLMIVISTTAVTMNASTLRMCCQEDYDCHACLFIQLLDVWALWATGLGQGLEGAPPRAHALIQQRFLGSLGN